MSKKAAKKFKKVWKEYLNKVLQNLDKILIKKNLIAHKY